jgi:hypothetical protein
MPISLEHHELKADLVGAASALGVSIACDESRDSDGDGAGTRRRVLTAALPRPTGVAARFVNQGILERAKKVFLNEIEVGSSWFDESIYVSTSTREATEKALENPRAQQALILLVDPSRRVEIEDTVIRVSDDDVRDDGRDATAELLALAACLTAS